MRICRVRIENYKCFQLLELDLEEGINIMVGNNEAGKSTVLESVHLALTGLLGGRYLRHELSQHLFNNEAVTQYIRSLQTSTPLPPPTILIEIYYDGDYPLFEGNGNTSKAPAVGFSLKIAFDDQYKREYQEMLKRKDIHTLPIEYYDIVWTSFARQTITPRSVTLKSALIDSSSVRYQNGSDIYISRIIRDLLQTQDVIGISQAYRKMKEAFRDDPSIAEVNNRIQTAASISTKRITVSAELPAKSDWEESLVTCVEDVPFHYIGKGEQCLIKTKLALSHRKAQEASVILLEEPENHLTHASLNSLLQDIKADNSHKQVIVSTHSSFVANKLGLGNLIFLNDQMTLRFTSLDNDTKRFFQRIAGYDTLRLILAKKAILVEGDSDELILQKAYMVHHDGRLPIADGLDVISVGTAFLRFLEIAKQINKPVVVVTDNDGDVDAITTKYQGYIGTHARDNISISYDTVIDTGDLQIGGKPFNYNTLEPKLVKSNSLEVINKILGTTYSDVNDLHDYMFRNKTECALRIFETSQSIAFPAYIMNAIG